MCAATFESELNATKWIQWRCGIPSTWNDSNVHTDTVIRRHAQTLALAASGILQLVFPLNLYFVWLKLWHAIWMYLNFVISFSIGRSKYVFHHRSSNRRQSAGIETYLLLWLILLVMLQSEWSIVCCLRVDDRVLHIKTRCARLRRRRRRQHKCISDCSWMTTIDRRFECNTCQSMKFIFTHSVSRILFLWLLVAAAAAAAAVVWIDCNKVNGKYWLAVIVRSTAQRAFNSIRWPNDGMK